MPIVTACLAGAVPKVGREECKGERDLLGSVGFQAWLRAGVQANANDNSMEQTPEAAKQLIEQGRLLGLDTGRLPALEQALAAFYAWEQEAKAALEEKGVHAQSLPSFSLHQPRLLGCTLDFAEPLVRMSGSYGNISCAKIDTPFGHPKT